MAVVLRSPCPACRQPLNIPANWVGHALRCKRCGTYLASRRKAKANGSVSQPTHAPLPEVAPLPSVLPMPQVAAPQPAPVWEPLPDYTPTAHAPLVAPLPTPYGQPTAPPAVPTAGGYVSAFDTRDRYAGRGNYRGPKKRAWVKPVVFAVLFLLVAGGAGTVYHFNPDLFTRKPDSGNNPDLAHTENKDVNKPQAKGNGSGEAVTGDFPRRMLAISVHTYLYANSLHNGDSGFALDAGRRTGTDAAIRKLAEKWHIPREQLYHLTDAPMIGETKTPEPKKGGARPKTSLINAVKQPPMKNVMEGAIQQFLETSREQDRIILMYCGHAIEKDGQVYLTPLEGDFDELESLVPLKKVYEQLAASKAQEKVVIFDVCRFHPERGAERPHAGPMSEALENGLHDSPDGVTVLTTCSKGEQSYELDYAFVQGKYELRGSFFLSSIFYASSEQGLTPKNKLQTPSDPLSIDLLANYMTEKLPTAAQQKVAPTKTQTPKLTLKRRAPGTEIAYNPSEPMAAHFEFPVPPPSADPKAVRSLLEEISLPPVKLARKDAPEVGIPDVLPFRKEVLEAYLDESQQPTKEFKDAVVGAVEEMRKLREAGGTGELREEFPGETNDAAKRAIQQDQKAPALVEATLKEQYDILREVGKMKDKQPKRWQAHYDYVYSQVLYRVCYVNQYNLALANVRTGKIPDLGKDQDGYRLTSEATLDKTTVKEYKQWYEEAKKISNELAKEHAGTPWALLAKSDRTLNLGLRVSPATFGKK